METENLSCQLFKYDKDFFLVNKNTPEYFAKNFLDEALDDSQVSWLNFHSIKDVENISLLCENLKVDKLAVEDIYTKKQRPKVEEYPAYVFFSVRSALPSESEAGNLINEQISFVLGQNYLISFQEKSSDHFTEVRDRIELNKGRIRTKGADFLLYRMLESIVENYFEVIEEIQQNTHRLEKRLIRSTEPNILKLIEHDKKRLAELRKIAIPMRDVASQIHKSENPLFKKENNYYFDDLKDACVGVLEEIDVNKQTLEGLTNLYYAVQGQRMNEIMKVLTVISAIFIPLTFLAGIYGMNFKNIPELKHEYGYFILLGAMFLITVTLVVVFKKRGWLNKY
jgi:magnesium transporter